MRGGSGDGSREGEARGGDDGGKGVVAVEIMVQGELEVVEMQSSRLNGG